MKVLSLLNVFILHLLSGRNAHCAEQNEAIFAARALAQMLNKQNFSDHYQLHCVLPGRLPTLKSLKGPGLSSQGLEN